MTEDVRRIVRERLNLALLALDQGDDARCGRLALSAAQATWNESPVPPEIADWPTWPQTECVGYISKSVHG